MSEQITNINFEHKMSAHCETGVTANLLRYYGIEFSEPMVFGFGAGLSFVYFPFMKLNGAPVCSFRTIPGSIFKKITKSLGIKVTRKKFKNSPNKAMQALDFTLKQNIPVGVLVGVYNLTYFPPALRFHFNAHNIVVYKKENNKYLVSDPIMENPEWINYEDLKTVRYAKGTYKPKGRMYYINSVNKDFDLKKVFKKSIRTTTNMMLKAPGTYVGISGIKTLAKHIKRWPKKYNSKKAAKYLGSVIRMQEEIGTGGAGFRFLYAAFLQETGNKFNNNDLIDASIKMTEIGNLWRQFAIDAARVIKDRTTENQNYNTVAKQLLEIADKEKQLFKQLSKIKL